MNILAIDLDQTLLHTDETVSAYTQAIFRRLKTETDHKVIVATGRACAPKNTWRPLKQTASFP